MADRWGAMARLAGYPAENLSRRDFDELCRRALEACGASRGEIALRADARAFRAGSAGWGARDLAEERRARLLAKAGARGCAAKAGDAELAASLGKGIGALLAFSERGFTAEEIEAAKAAAAVIGEKVELDRAGKLLSSRFALAALSEAGFGGSEALEVFTREPEKAARLLGRGFCAELRRRGFGPKEALSAGIEVIGEATRMAKAPRAGAGEKAAGKERPKGRGPGR